jgi:hypothetical protein
MRHALSGSVLMTMLMICGLGIAPGSAGADYTAGSVIVVRVGDGSAAPTNASTPVFLDNYAPDGTLLGTLPLPIEPSGDQFPLTVSGTATSEGALQRSANGRYVVMAGYGAPPGVASIASTSSATVNRVVGRISSTGEINTTTAMAVAFSGNNVRGATTDDGSAFWVSGTASGSGVAGIEYTLLGATSGEVQVLATPNNTRTVAIQNGQLYGSSGSGAYTNVFTVGSGLPTTPGQTATTLPGFPTSGASPYAFALSPDGTICYVADDRSVASGGGVQKWTFDGTLWTLAATFTDGLNSGARGLTVDWSGPDPLILCTTADSPGNRLAQIVDDGGSPTAVVLATAPTNTSFRGVAYAPTYIVSAVDEGAGSSDLLLAFPQPNPAGGATMLRYALPHSGLVRLTVLDAEGRAVMFLQDGLQGAGDHAVTWDLRDGRGDAVPKGLYFVRFEFAGRVETRQVVVTR